MIQRSGSRSVGLRILFVHNNPTSFVRTDQYLLEEAYQVREWYQRSRAVNLIALARAVAESDLVFGWFASWHTLFPMLLARLFKRPSVLVVGGYDTADMPEIGYGSQRGGIKRLVSRRTIHAATCLVTQSIFTRDEAVRNTGADPRRIRLVYHGLEPPESDRHLRQSNLVITVGKVDRSNLLRKGLEPFTRAAGSLPAVEFVVVGPWLDNAIDYLRTIAPPNIRFTGWVGDAELRDHFSRAQVYVQASRHEAFGLSVAEAMRQGCVPVVTRAGALPEVVGNAGIYVDSTGPAVLASAIRHALALGDEWRCRARDRILTEFTLASRREGLYAVLTEALDARV